MTKAPATFGSNLRRARLKAKLTQEELAARLGFKRTTPISIWERGNHVPEPKTIVKLAEAIQCPPARLLRGVTTPYDALRGSRKVIAGTTAIAASLSELEIRLLTLARQLPAKMVASHCDLMEGELRLFGKPNGVLGAVDARFRLAGPERETPPLADTAQGGSRVRPHRR